MNLKDKIQKVNDSLTLNRYDNGWMIEVNGKDAENEWVTVKLVCNTQEEIFALIAAYNKLEVDR